MKKLMYFVVWNADGELKSRAFTNRKRAVGYLREFVETARRHSCALERKLNVRLFGGTLEESGK